MNTLAKVGVWMFFIGMLELAVLILSWCICELINYNVIFKEILVGFGLISMFSGIGILMLLPKK